MHCKKYDQPQLLIYIKYINNIKFSTDRCYNRYFRAMANGETPPVKERLEMPVATQKTDTGLTPGLLKVLHKQVGLQNTAVRTIMHFPTSKA